jgi:glycosyltransferase involved in cell wall biosynthesis
VSSVSSLCLRGSPFFLTGVGALARRLPQGAFEAMEVAYNGPATARLLRVASEWRPDVIYERSAAFCVAGALVSRRLGVPLVVEFNDVAGLAGVREQRFAWLSRALEGAVLRTAAAAVPVTSYLRDQLQTRGLDPARIAVIGNGFDPQRFHSDLDGAEIRHRYGVTESECLVGFSGAMSPWYRLVEMVQAFADRFARSPRVRLLLIGDGPDRDAVQRKIVALGGSRQVILGPRVPHEEVPAHLAAFDIALIPHCNQHGSPVKLFEYLGAARPLVAVRTPGVTDIVTHEREALLAEPGDLDTLMRQVSWLAMNPRAGAAMGRRGHALVHRRYTWAHRAEETDQVLVRAVAGQARFRARFLSSREA